VDVGKPFKVLILCPHDGLMDASRRQNNTIGHRQSIPASQTSQRRSYTVSLALDGRIDPLDETPRLLRGNDRHKFNPIIVENHLHLLTGFEPKRPANPQRDNDLILWRNRDDFHSNLLILIDHDIVLRS
jgi:hypothetical protein